jgi:hypothetical protein
MDIESLNISPTNDWSADKKRFWDHLQVLTSRIIDKNIDITSNLNSDYYLVRMTYAAYAEDKNANTLFHKVVSLAADYNYDRCEDEFQKAVPKTKFKTLKKLLEICRYHGIDTDFEDEASPSDARQSDYLPEGVNEEFFDDYGFFEKSNQYYTLEAAGQGRWNPKPFTNFVMKVLFHMNNGMQPRRVIELTNFKGKNKIVDIPTDRLTSKNDFKKFCEGLGNYRFFGSDGKLDMIKAFLYEQENECQEINVLGWHEDGFWSWSNGIYNAKFHPLDHNGFVELHDKHYYIPSGNQQQPNRNRRFSNELRFKHFPDQPATFTEWALLYNNVFPVNGSIILTFAISCLFSDIVFNTKQFFPILFIYGEGGSGKGSAIKMAQRIYGIPQDPLTLSGKANTDKAKIAIFAQFVNTMLLLEEYSPNHDTDQLIKNLWDRYGYKRRTMDMGYGTETVPIQSGVAITANFTPTDDPLLQRVIYLDHNVNQFTQEQHQKFNALKEFSEKGITSCTHELLSKRSVIEKQFRERQMAIYKEIKGNFAALGNCTDRMIENISVLITIYTLLSENNIVFPFTRDHLIQELVSSTARQNEKRDSGGEVQKFFDIFLSAVTKGEIIEDVHYKIDDRHLAFNVKQIYGVYAQYHRSFYNQAGLSMGNLRDKLKIHPAYSGYVDVQRIGEGRTSAFLFHYDKIGIDLISAASVYRGARKSRNGLQESYEDKIRNQRPEMFDPIPGDGF